MNQIIKERLPKILIILGYVVFYSLTYFFNLECLWKYIFDIPCPGCGFTRAIKYALKLDFANAFSCHPMIWSFPIIIFYFLFGDKIKSKIIDYIMLVILFAFFVVWIYRLLI